MDTAQQELLLQNDKQWSKGAVIEYINSKNINTVSIKLKNFFCSLILLVG